MIELSVKQQKILDSEARIKLIMGGVRSGKTLISLLCLKKEMEKLNSKKTNVIIYEAGERYQQLMIKEIKHYLEDILIEISSNTKTIKTIYGSIEISARKTSEEFINYTEYKKYVNNYMKKYNIFLIDNASKNKSISDIVFHLPDKSNLIVAGHCPEDEKNEFYNEWYEIKYDRFSLEEELEKEAFKLTTWDNPTMVDKKEEKELELIKSMGLERYIRDYYAILI